MKNGRGNVTGPLFVREPHGSGELGKPLLWNKSSIGCHHTIDVVIGSGPCFEIISGGGAYIWGRWRTHNTEKRLFSENLVWCCLMFPWSWHHEWQSFSGPKEGVHISIGEGFMTWTSVWIVQRLIYILVVEICPLPVFPNSTKEKLHPTNTVVLLYKSWSQ